MTMQRPIMDPHFLHEDDDPSSPAPRRQILAQLGRALARAGRLAGRLLFYDPIDSLIRAGKFRVDEDASRMRRVLRGMMYRLAFVPVGVALTVALIVYLATHPRAVATELDPTSLGIYYDAVRFVSEDHVPLDGWLVPVLQARHIIEQGDHALGRKHPAVVLVHDFAAHPAQMLPLIQPLHEAGYVTLTVGLRGTGPTSAGRTFGVRESRDVRAGIELLRRLAYVDGSRIAAMGVGTGATACLLAADEDPTITALVLNDPVRDIADLLDGSLGPRQSWLAWMRPLCRWAFEMAYGVEGGQLSLTRYSRTLSERPVLMVQGHVLTSGAADPQRLTQVVAFLDQHLGKPK